MSYKRKRDISLRFRVTPEELELLKARMASVGTGNLEAFLRKMALDGILVKLDMAEIREMISLMRYMGNNVNQIAKRLNESGKYYDTDIEDVIKNQKRLIGLANAIFGKLASLK